METLESFVLGHPYLAIYAFCCTELITAVMIACKSRSITFFAVSLALIGSALVPAGHLSYYS
jgi:hypothetical protein